MKCSAWEFYVIAVYGGIRDIYNGELWMVAMRLCESLAVDSHNDFCQLDKRLLMALRSTRNSSYTSNYSTQDGQSSPAITPDSPV